MNVASSNKSSGLQLGGRRGGPLALIGLLLVSWAIGRSVLWESPFLLPEIDLPGVELPLASAQDALDSEFAAKNLDAADLKLRGYNGLFPPVAPMASPLFANASFASLRPAPRMLRSANIAVGHQQLMRRAFGVDWHTAGVERGFGTGPWANAVMSNRAQGQFAGRYPTSAPPPFNPFPSLGERQQKARRPDRWTLDTFGFFRQGSGSLSTSQGRVPVYGASQSAANLQYRFAPDWGFDPRGYLRAYQALVDGGEVEVAAGLSARVVPQVPVRLYGEMRVSRNPVGTDYRPAVYAVTELPPQSLADFSLETYAAAGYVGGDADTYFADGQATLTREVVNFTDPTGRPVRISLGAGGWGGAQRGAERVDVGPTMRFDLNVGALPTRISVDWRERVFGDAAPESGVAATVSTQF